MYPVLDTRVIFMATKSANGTARVESEVKYKAEQIIMKKGIPYPLTVNEGPITVAEMSKSEFDSMIKNGLEQAKNGESMPVEEAFNDLLKAI